MTHTALQAGISREYLAGRKGEFLRQHDIPHVQGKSTTGYAFHDEERTLIVALMRGGEPMALGVSEMFPRAAFLHAKHGTDVTPDHLVGVREGFLVDSVINSGKSILEFARYARMVSADNLRITIVAWVVQSESLTGVRMEELRELAGDGDEVRVRLVALRLSENKYTGSGTTDTGNRLFNTTKLA